MIANASSTIWERVIDPDLPNLNAAAARGILTLGFPADDLGRMNDLSAKARAGTLTPDEDRDLESYLEVSRVLNILHSKARRSLRTSKEC